MTCEQFELILEDLVRAGDAAAAPNALGMFHAETCARCGKLLQEARALTAGLRTLATTTEGQQAPERVEAALRAAFAQNRKAASRARTLRWVGGGAAAAALILAAVTAHIWRATDRVEQAKTVVTPARPGGQLPRVGSGATANPAQSLGGVARKNRRRASRILEGDEQSDAGFVLLPYGGALTPFERGQIVRIRMPRSALVPFGFSVNEEGASEWITADLLLEEDGAPRAIRFVR